MIVLLLTFILAGCSKYNEAPQTLANPEVSKVTAAKSDKAKAYILAFDKVWEMDPGLNSAIKYISINTKTFRNFSGADKKELFDYVAGKYNVTMLDMSIDELKDAGYVKDLYFKEGIVFEISKYISDTPDIISFEGRKWRSGLGAIGFSFETRKKSGSWELEKCNMTWIS